MRWEVEIGGSVIVDVDDPEDVESEARARIEHDSDWATIRKCRQLKDDPEK